MIDIDVYSKFSVSLKKIWEEFEKEAVMTPFQSYAWLSHWQDAVGGPLLTVSPQIVHIQDKSKTLALVPFGIRNKFGIKILEWIGGTNSDYMGPLLHPDFLSKLNNKELWSTINSKIVKYDVIHLQKQPERVLQFFDRIGFLHNSDPTIRAYKATLPSFWDDYYNRIKKKLRSDSRRQHRRLVEINKVKFIHGETFEEKSEIIKAMIIQKSRRYRETKVWNMLGVKEYQNFYKRLAKLTSNNFKVHCASLSVGTTLVATHIGIFDDETFYYLMPANEGDDWKKYSPGRLLLLELLKWSIDNKLKFFDFTVGGETYKKDWCDIDTDLFETCKSFSSFGFAYIFSLFIKKKLKKVKFLPRIVRSMRK